MQASDEPEHISDQAFYAHLYIFLNNDHRSGDKSGIYIDAEAEAEAKFMLLLQTLFTLKQKQKQKQKHSRKAWLRLSINCNILLDIPSLRDDTNIHRCIVLPLFIFWFFSRSIIANLIFPIELTTLMELVAYTNIE